MTGISTAITNIVNASDRTTATKQADSGTTKSASQSATDRTSMDKDTFLKLLVAQMKFQDPDKPTDPSQFLTQSAQFTVVEKLAQLETSNQQVLDASRAQSATSLIGQTVTWKDVAGKSHTGKVTGATLGASMPTLTVDGASVSYSDLVQVGTAPAAATG